MGFNLNHLHSRVVLFVVIYATATVFAAENVTVDDRSPSIIYSPPGAWSQSAQNPLDYGGTHMLTQNPNATASFNFTGTAIYFLSPLWPYSVNTAVSLDSGPITLIDLVDHSRPDAGEGPETAQSHIVWNAIGLANTQHNLLISVGAGQLYAIVDGLIFTNATDTSSSTSSSLSPTPTTTTLSGPIIASSTANATLTSSDKSKPSSIVAIALGSLFGLLGLLVIFWGVWYFFRRRKRPVSEAWTDAPHISPIGPNATDKNGIWTADELYNNGYSMTQSNDGKSWYNSRYQNVGMPAPPIPSQPYYNGGYYQNDIINSRQHQMAVRIPNRYEPGTALSTITERSTPQMGEGRTPLANTPASFQPSELEEYYTALQGSEASHSISRQQYQHQHQPQPPPPLISVHRVPSPHNQDYPSQRRKPVEHKPAGNWF